MANTLRDLSNSVTIPPVVHSQLDPRPLVTIIMPAFNAGQSISDSIRSVFEQTYTAWELIVVDDNSTDLTRAIVSQFCSLDNRITLLSQSENLGVAAARNRALASTDNPLVAFLDSDDLWLPLKLETQVNFMVKHGHAFTFTNYRRFDGVTSIVGEVVEGPKELDYEGLLRQSAIACLTVMLDRRRCGEIFFSKIRHEDFALWLAVLKRDVKAYCLSEDLARYRVAPGSLSSNKFKSALWVWNVYRHSEKLNAFKSAICFSQYVVRALAKRIKTSKRARE